MEFSRSLILLPCFLLASSCQQVSEAPAEQPTVVAVKVQQPAEKQNERLIQVVFALDATGSMAGLIGTAKEKIWSITSGLSQSQNTRVEIGLVFYRDRGDDFVTRRISISPDLDDVYEQLMAIAADGGGDSPESVNQGLYEAVTAMNWSQDTSAFKSIFLVGDCPPHMDYKDDVKYPKTCVLAKQKEITINTILMGEEHDTKRIWKEIASCAGGDFTQTGMNANNLEVKTPYDDDISRISGQLDETRIYYGSADMKMKQESKRVQSMKLKDGASVTSNTRRAEYFNTKKGKEVYYGSNELINDFKNKKVNLDSIKKEALPDHLAAMSPAQRKKYVSNLAAQRDSLDKKMAELVKLRSEYIDKELAKKDKSVVENSFDHKVYESVKKQASKKKIELEGKEKY